VGKEYATELKSFPDTFNLARTIDISPYENAVARMRGGDVIVIASGGSVCAAHLLVQLHMAHTGKIAQVMTPLEFAMDEHSVQATIVFLSASGTNRDILNAWETAQRRGIRELFVICAAPKSKLVQLAVEHKVGGVIAFELSAGRDGFLATNSLLAFCCLLLRLYAEELPKDMPKSVVPGSDALLDKDTLVVLYGGWLKPIAIDIESRFVEAAILAVQVADYRNFAHGRHHWIAKHGQRTAVLALIAPKFRDLAEDTLKELPADTTVEKLEVQTDSPSEMLGALLSSIELTGRAAKRRGYDAGRPGVPEFGTRIYELSTPVSREVVRRRQEPSLTRKILTAGAVTLAQRADLQSGFAAFKKELEDTTFAGVVLDYDGTIVDTHKRFDPIDAQMAEALNRLLADGLVLGFATGRGKSIHKELQRAIEAKRHDRCFVGYYNGAVVRALSAGCDDLTKGEPERELKTADHVLREMHGLNDADIETRPFQITVTCRSLSENALWLAVQEALERNAIFLKVMRSSHSVDVIPHHVSKKTVVSHIASVANVDERRVLKIGDRGRWPGNDAEFLSQSHGLSVDEVSAAARSCWNLLPFGLRGSKGTLQYLDHLRGARYRGG